MANPISTPYNSIIPEVNLDEINTAYTPTAKPSEGLEFAEADSNNDDLFNEILWKGIKGEQAKLPAPRRGAFVKISKVEVDD